MNPLNLATAAAVALAGLALPGTAAQAAPVPPVTSSVSLVLAQTAQHRNGLAALAREPGASRTSFRSLEPGSAQRATVLSWAAGHGLTVAHTGPFVVQLTGDARLLAGLFGTSVRVSRFAGRAVTTAAASPTVPAVLSGQVAAVVGLDDRPVFKHATSYDGPVLQRLGNLSTTGYDTAAGAGATVGTVNLGGWYSSDLSTYAAHYGLPLAPGQITPITVGSGNPTATAATDNGASSEVALDAESILATAPAAKQRMYFGGNTAADYLAILDQMTADAANGLLHTASSSWGSCEPWMGASTLSAASAAVERLVAAGATFFASSGDDAAYDCSSSTAVDNTPAVDFPASAPYTVAVGGIRAVANSDGTFTSSAWGPSSVSAPGSSFAGWGSGGGQSSVFGRPTWQGGTGDSSAWRTVPDIASLGDPATGFTTYDTFDGGWVAVGGTSLASPLSAASLAVVEARSGALGLGNILPALYARPLAFHDITSGTNGLYAATTGYDRVTGLGSPDWQALAPALLSGGTSAPGTAPTFTLPALTRSTAPAVTVTDPNASSTSRYKVTDGPADCVAGMSSSLPTSVSLTSGQGLHTVTLNVLDADGTCHTTQATTLLDTVAPALTAGALPTFTLAAAVGLRWTGADVTSGVAAYDVRYRKAAFNAGFGSLVYPLLWQGTPSTQVSLPASKGYTYCLSVRARDKAGNVSGWSPERCTATALDDRSLATSSGWVRGTATAYYASTVTGTTHTGAYLVRTGVQARHLALVATRCSACGTVGVYWNGTLIRTISFYGTSTAQHQVFVIGDLGAARTGTLTIKALNGRRTYLDGLASSRV
jgi:hypothetical protein